MELTVFERLLLRNIVPQMSGWNFGSMKTARELLENLFDENEEKKLQITVGEDGKSVEWKRIDDKGKPIPQTKDLKVTDGLKNKIAKFLKELDGQDKLEFAHYSLFEKFTGE